MGFVTTEQEWTVMQMREILFRGKRIDDGKTVEGLYIFDGFKHYIVKFHTDENAFGTLYPVDETFEVTPETVGQFTGLIDKNGKRIFEGDIVAQIWYGHDEPSNDSFGEVVFCEYDCSFSVMDIQKDGVVPLGRCHAYHWEAEVIGNIHDNPELLEDADA